MSPREVAAQRLRTVVVGFGAIAQSKYVPALLKLDTLYDVVAVVNPSEAPRRLALDRFPGAVALMALPDDLSPLPEVDAAIVLTPPGSRAPIVQQLLDYGVPVLAEKPLALTASAAADLARRAIARNTLLMVAHTRRFDPAYAVLLTSLDAKRITTASAITFETPWQPIVALAPLARPLNATPEFERPVDAIDRCAIAAELGTSDDRLLRYYRWVITEAIVHDLDLLAHVLGPATSVAVCRLSDRDAGLTAVVRFGDIDAVVQWSHAAGLAGYEQTFTFTGSDCRYTLTYPSPFLLNAPAILVIDSSARDSTGHISTSIVPSHEDAFVRLLKEFARRVSSGDSGPSSALEATRALQVGEALALAHIRSTPIIVSEDADLELATTRSR